MLSRSSPAAVPDRDRDRDNLPLKKREQRWTAPPSHQQQCEAATFKAPYPRRSCTEARSKLASPFRPLPKRAPPLHQPWIHACSPTSSMPQVVSAFRAHQGWTDWTESTPQYPGWEGANIFQHHSHLSPLLHAGEHPSRLSAGSRVGDCDQLRGRNFSAWWTVDERNGGPYLKRSRKTESLPKASRPGPSTPPPGWPQQVLQTSPRLFRTSPSEQSFTKSSQPSSAHVSVRDGASIQSGRPSPHPRPPNRLPWLLPHFLAGSLIELRDGRLRRVEHLQTEDFLLGAMACPDLRLSCCTVQSITPSASSSISRLLILLHDQRSQVSHFPHSSRSVEQFTFTSLNCPCLQELVDVYAEYPFFVQDHGWSSCSPQRTARLCGLQCRQLSVGDVCLALTPLSAPQRPLRADPQPEATPTISEKAQESPRAPQSRVPPGPGQPAGEQRKEQIRRRHRSAPELRGGGAGGGS